jgi:hypothetical protein
MLLGPGWYSAAVDELGVSCGVSCGVKPVGEVVTAGQQGLARSNDF